MILPLLVFGKTVRAHWIFSGVAMGPISVRTSATSVFFRIIGFAHTGLQGDIGVNRLPLQIMGIADNSRATGDGRMRNQGALDFRRTHPVLPTHDRNGSDR